MAATAQKSQQAYVFFVGKPNSQVFSKRVSLRHFLNSSSSSHICWSTKRNWMALCWIWRRLNIHQWVSDLICKIIFLLDSSDLSPNRICKIMFQLDFQLKEEVGDTGTYVMNGEWALLGNSQPTSTQNPKRSERQPQLISFRLFLVLTFYYTYLLSWNF